MTYEDLYLRGAVIDSGEWKLAVCVCQTIACLDGDIIFSQDIPGNSLNKLYNNTVMYYFPLMRSGSCSSFRDFYQISINSEPKLYNFKMHQNHKKIRFEKMKQLKRE